jgi:hypothetical protein
MIKCVASGHIRDQTKKIVSMQDASALSDHF